MRTDSPSVQPICIRWARLAKVSKARGSWSRIVTRRPRATTKVTGAITGRSPSVRAGMIAVMTSAPSST
jgi:hypothetical protein